MRANNSLIAKNTAFLYVRMLIVLLVSLYTARVVLNTLGVDDYGINNVVAGFVSMFGFLNSSLTACIQRYYNYENGRVGDKGLQNVFIIAFYIEIALSVVIFILLEILGLWYIGNRLVLPPERLAAAKCIFHFSALQLVLVMLQVPYSAAILSKEHMDYYALVGILDVFLKLLIVILLPYIPYDKLIIYGLFNLCIAVINFLAYFLFVKIKYPILKLRLYWDRKLFKSMLSFSGWNVFGSVAIVARTQGINLLLNVFFGTVVNAARGVAFQIQSAMMGFIHNITVAVRPQLTESYAAGNIERSTNLMETISKACFIMLYIMVLPVIYEIDYILNIWLGNNVPQYTSTFTVLILITALIDVLNTPVTMIVMASGKVSLYSFATSLIGLLILPCSYIFLSFEYSPSIVFVVGIFVSILVQAASLMIMKRETSVSIGDYIRNVLVPLLIMIVITMFIPMPLKDVMANGIIRMIIITFISTVSILLVSYFVCLRPSEKDYIISTIKSFIRR